MPSQDLLRPYAEDPHGLAAAYGVTYRTATNWLRKVGLFTPRPNFGCNKLGMEKARVMRRLHREGKPAKELAAMFGVTTAAVSRVLGRVTYREREAGADVSVIYNAGVTAAGAGGAASAAPS